MAERVSWHCTNARRTCGWSGATPDVTDFTYVVFDYYGRSVKERIAGCVCPNCGGAVRRDPDVETVEFKRVRSVAA